MKKIIIAIVLTLCAITISAQSDTTNFVRQGNNFTKVQKVQSSQDICTSYTYTVKDVTYPIWITRNGRCYVIRTSKQGKQYKQYMEEAISRQICAELGIEYKESVKG